MGGAGVEIAVVGTEPDCEEFDICLLGRGDYRRENGEGVGRVVAAVNMSLGMKSSLMARTRILDG